VPGGGNSQRSALPAALHRSHGGASAAHQHTIYGRDSRTRDQPLWMHFCFALRHETQATGLRIAGDGDGRGHRRRGPEAAALATFSRAAQAGRSPASRGDWLHARADVRRQPHTCKATATIVLRPLASQRASSACARVQGPPSSRCHLGSAVRNMGAPCTRCDAATHTIRTRISGRPLPAL
jgi:hypothetical protein